MDEAEKRHVAYGRIAVDHFHHINEFVANVSNG
jgi:hypothetical protein